MYSLWTCLDYFYSVKPPPNSTGLLLSEGFSFSWVRLPIILIKIFLSAHKYILAWLKLSWYFLSLPIRILKMGMTFLQGLPAVLLYSEVTAFFPQQNTKNSTHIKFTPFFRLQPVFIVFDHKLCPQSLHAKTCYQQHHLWPCQVFWYSRCFW